MSQPTSSKDPARSIRQRLLLLLLRSFGTVVLLTVVLVLGAGVLFISLAAGQDRFYRLPAAAPLESYYLGRGSWQGIETLLAENLAGEGLAFLPDLERMLLLDEAGHVVLDHGRTGTGAIGQLYQDRPGDLRVGLYAGGQQVGALVLAPRFLSHPLRLALGVLLPVSAVSVFLGLLTLVIGLLLMRRVVNPLAEVIAAAQAVAGGDLTARVPVRGPHDDLRTLSDHFNRMAAALESSAAERRNLLADIAHELRTPLAILRGKLEGILDGIYTADEAHIAPALEEVYLLERLVEDLRLLTLAEMRRLPFELRPCDLSEVAEHSAGLFEAQAAERGIRLEVEAPPGLPPVQADPQRIEQVVGNLVGNALRYTPEGGRVRIRVQAAGANLQLEVLDSGPGVPEAELPHIFDRFWRGEKSRARSTGGAGLGLAIARQFVEAQGGAIWARNLPEGGFCAGFSLPGFSPPAAP